MSERVSERVKAAQLFISACGCVYVCPVLYHTHCRSEVCCHGCSEDNLLSAITDAFSVPSLDDVRVELDFGHFNGTLLRHPTPQPPSECTTEDSNLQ